LSSDDESGDLAVRIAKSRENTVARLELMYRPELSTLPANERKELLIALEALTDHESWARMREMFQLSFEEACAVWVTAIDRLLPPTPAGPQ
jgi:hypothetical protein